MRSMSPNAVRKGLFGAVLLAFLLAASLLAATVFGAEARMKRASAKLVRLAEKPAEESAVALGLAANRLGKFLAADAALELETYGPLAAGRQEIVALFAQIRASLALIAFAHPRIVAAKAGPGVVNVRVAVRYRLAPGAGEAAEGDGTAELVWTKGEDGWRISRATLRAADAARLPGGWK